MEISARVGFINTKLRVEKVIVLLILLKYWNLGTEVSFLVPHRKAREIINYRGTFCYLAMSKTKFHWNYNHANSQVTSCTLKSFPSKPKENPLNWS